MKIISICNHKGGCAKTTTVVNIAAELVNLGYKVLIIDNDYQANLTTSVGFKTDQESLVNSLRGKKSLRKTIKKCTILDGLDIIPNNSEVGNCDLALIKMKNCKRLLSNLIEEENLKDDYDFILIDCPPSQSITTINALVASDSIIIPMEPSLFNMQGLKSLSKTIKLIQNTFNKKLKVDYDFILIDCPPSQSITTINALVASDSIIIPMEPSLFNMQGLRSSSK